METKQLIDAIHLGLQSVEKFAPMLGGLGIPGVAAASAIAGTLASVGANVMQRIEDGQLVATTGDQAVLRALLARIQEQNDQLAARIDADEPT